MTEIHPDLFIGNEADYESFVKHQEGWWVIHACKEPYHRKLLGYRGRGAPKNHPEYLIAERGRKLFLNLVDANDPAYIPKEIIDVSLHFIDKGLQSGGRVLVHCNQGESRSPSIGLLYLATHTTTISRTSLAEAETSFRQIYPAYNPKGGMRGFLMSHWNHYVNGEIGNA
ncbi:dual specificity protein phosphatase family protein [bacterium AH-315-C08]|nr:dual specificity protein phosphatase family protein [bacterium AH-315-C08]